MTEPKPEIILVGGGGHCKSCIDVIEQDDRYRIAGIIDLQEKQDEDVLGYRMIGTDEDIPGLVKDHLNFLVTLGQIKSAAKRITLFNTLKDKNANLPVIISPRAYVSIHATIGDGTIIMPGAIVNASTRIGENCIINSGAIIEHDVIVEDHCHVSTGAIVNGGTILGAHSFLGSNSVTREYIKIAEESVIGIGSKVKESIDKAMKKDSGQ